MRAHVSSQQPGSGEGLAAGGADAGQRVGADVHLERPHAAVLFVAVVAGVEGAVRGLGGWAGRGRSVELELLLLLQLQLVGCQGLGALVAIAAVLAVEKGRSHIGTGRVRRAAAVLLTLAAAGRRGGGAAATAEVQWN